jgi:hypothetical protein
MTRRGALFGAGLATAAVLALVIWLAPGRSRSTPRPGLTLLVNMRTRVEVTPGTPLVFDLSIGSGPSSPAFTVGSRWGAWHTLLRLEEAAANGPVPWVLTLVGPPRSLHMGLDSARRPEVTTDASLVARLEGGRHLHSVTLAAAPDVTARIPPGTYRLRAVLETPFWLRWGWRGRVESAPATVVVIDPPTAGEKREHLEAQRLARAAEFHLDTGRFADAHQAAAELVRLRPNESRSYILLGDASAGLNLRQEALDAYRHAMALLPRSYEEPTLLFERMKTVGGF